MFSVLIARARASPTVCHMKQSDTELLGGCGVINYLFLRPVPLPSWRRGREGPLEPGQSAVTELVKVILINTFLNDASLDCKGQKAI